jgi:tetratricopeptide (TPR) repeat protein
MEDESDESNRVTLEGKTYVWTGKSWIDFDTFTHAPPEMVPKLNAKLLSRLQEEDENVSDLQELLVRAKDAKSQGHFKRAEGLVRRLLQFDPENLWAVAILCSCLRAIGKPEEALKELAPYCDRKFAPLLHARAAALCDLGRWEEARIEISKALSIQKKHESVKFTEPYRVLKRIRSARPDLFKGDSKTRGVE